MSDIKMLADDIQALPPNTAFRLTPTAQRMIVRSLRMVGAVDRMLAQIGFNGLIRADDELVHDVMRVLDEIDPK